MNEGRLFDGVLNREYFLSLTSTSDKVKHCLEKGVFHSMESGEGWSKNDIKCRNYSNWDLTSLDDQPFSLNTFYKYGNHSISLNPWLGAELLETFDTQIGFSDMSGEIDFNLDILFDVKSKIEYLNSVIKENDPFKITEFRVEYYKWSKDMTPLKLETNSAISFSERFEKYLSDYLLGYVCSHSLFNISKYPEMKNYASEYYKFHKAKYCLFLIEDLMNPEEIEEEEVQGNNIGYNALLATYFFEKTGLIKKMTKAGFNESAKNKLIGKITSRHYKTIETKRVELLDINSLSDIRRKSLKEIDEIIQSFSNM
ncbi:hypothetical protein [Maribacter sp. LLG6340-A2]|uniref:hypothetical protein n=1 Tax=Maribacter sp. LLG6340-A2 TaxID=3160834 RepID=UPI003863472B